MSKIKLKPCPFCGSTDAPRLYTRHGKDGWRDRYMVLCDYDDGGCGSSSGWYHYPGEAVECWNRRANSDDLSPVGEENNNGLSEGRAFERKERKENNV